MSKPPEPQAGHAAHAGCVSLRSHRGLLAAGSVSTASAGAAGAAATAAAATAASTAAAAGLAVAAPLIAEVVGFVGAQNPAWIQPGLDPSKLTWGPPSAAECASMATLPAVQVTGWSWGIHSLFCSWAPKGDGRQRVSVRHA
jgi:hypothetical protein